MRPARGAMSAPRSSSSGWTCPRRSARGPRRSRPRPRASRPATAPGSRRRRRRGRPQIAWGTAWGTAWGPASGWRPAWSLRVGLAEVGVHDPPGRASPRRACRRRCGAPSVAAPRCARPPRVITRMLCSMATRVTPPPLQLPSTSSHQARGCCAGRCCRGPRPGAARGARGEAARASSRRWRWPVDSVPRHWRGLGPGRRGRGSRGRCARVAHLVAAAQRADDDIVEHGHARERAQLLESARHAERHTWSGEAPSSARRRAAPCPASGGRSRVTTSNSVDLPAPFGPITPTARRAPPRTRCPGAATPPKVPAVPITRSHGNSPRRAGGATHPASEPTSPPGAKRTTGSSMSPR